MQSLFIAPDVHNNAIQLHNVAQNNITITQDCNTSQTMQNNVTILHHNNNLVNVLLC